MEKVKYFEQLIKDIKKPTVPFKYQEPLMEMYASLAEWGAALDTYNANFDKARAQYKQETQEYNNRVFEIESQFWDYLYKTFGWDTLPESIANSLQTYVYNECHHEVQYFCAFMNKAEELNGIVNVIKQELK